MATAYGQLLAEVCPRPIRSERAYDKALRQIEELMSKPRRTRNDEDLLGVLVLLVEDYESNNCEPIATATTDVLLRHLMDARGVNAATLASDTGIPKSTVSEMLSGTRGISRRNITRLAEYFSVSPQLLLEAPVTQ